MPKLIRDSDRNAKSQDNLDKSPTLRWFHRYPARFPNNLVERLIRQMPGACHVLDPFAGAGTTLAACRQFGIRATGLELSHLGVLITQVRLTPPLDLPQTVTRIEDWVEGAKRGNAGRIQSPLRAWLGTANSSQLQHLLHRIRGVRDSRVKRFIQLALSSALRPSSRWLAGSIKPQIDPVRHPPDLSLNLLRAARALARDCAAEAGTEASSECRIITGDARILPFSAAAFDAIVTSPPYGSMYDYFDVQRLSYLAFGWPIFPDHQIGRKYGVAIDGKRFTPPNALLPWYRDYLGGERTTQGRALRAYAQDMEAHLREAIRVLRPGGIAAYAVANSVRRRGVIDFAKALREQMSRAGFVKVRSVHRRRDGRTILPGTRNRRTGRFSSRSQSHAVAERVVYARKPG